MRIPPYLKTDNRVNNMKKFKIAVTNCNGWNQVGFIATKDDFVSSKVFIKRTDADTFAQSQSDWNSQFDNQGIGFLVCRKTPCKGWVVVAQF
jgi:hypothetical protein